MSPAKPNNLILIGFDRCGSSAISRTLANHPKIELIFQPFNSGSIRKKMYQIMCDQNATVEDHTFFKKLENNELWNDYIVSEWHRKYSTVYEFKKDHLHIIKTTLNHFTIHWVQRKFPALELWGIWREPLSILASIERNHCYNKWYKDALAEVSETVATCPLLSEQFGCFIGKCENETQAAAFLIAVRSYYLFYYLENSKIIIYEKFTDSPNEELTKICSYFDIGLFDFHQFINDDLNVSGKSYEKNKDHTKTINSKDRKFAETLFNPLIDLLNKKLAGIA